MYRSLDEKVGQMYNLKIWILLIENLWNGLVQKYWERKSDTKY